MAKRKLEQRLIDIEDINEELTPIEDCINEYITPNGNIYTLYNDNNYIKKSTFINKYNGYMYVNLNVKDGVIQRRVHRLIAKTFIPNPDNLPVVMHKDNNKTNNAISNLKWGTVQENTKAAYDDGLAINDKGFDDSQSMPIIQFDLNENLIKVYGSVGVASKELGITKTGILYQCKHKMRTKPRCGWYFRFLAEYEEQGFVV